MTLTLVMIRCPDDVTPERREVRGGEFSIGRGPDNDWIISDPERYLSKRHCMLAYRAGEWEISDLSSNGTFLNRSDSPIGASAARQLRDGDRIRFGAYELEVSIREDAPSAGMPTGFERGAGSRADSGFGSGARERDELDPFAWPPASDRREEVGGLNPEPPFGSSPILPPDFDPLAPPEEPFTGPTQSDHAPAMDSAFRSPPAARAIIPDDWDIDLPAGPTPPGMSQPEMPPRAMPDVAPPIPQAPAAPAPAAPASAQPAPATTMATADARLLEAFLHGVGLEDTEVTDPAAMLERVGAVMRAAVNGMRQVLMARASVKDEFRIEQTLIRASGNNPLKFSVDDDDALAMLLGLGRRGANKPEAAMTEAFRDMRMHELATISAMQAAVRVLLGQFDPAGLERSAGSNALDILPAQRKARAWEAFAALHQSVTQALSDDFDSVFGKAFARAYEQAIDELTERENP